MKAPALLMMSVLAVSALAGCFGGSASSDFDYEPGKNWKPTGKTVEIRMWVADITNKEVYPGLNVDMWAFCAEPVDPDDAYSAAAIEYRDEGSKCSVPGPQLRVTQGDKVIVHFENDHFHAHTIHWHGQHLPMEADGAPGVSQDSVVAGTVYKYEFIAKRAGTLWYHCHVDGQFHVMMGLYGVIIVEPQDTTWEPKVDDEVTLVFSTARREEIEHIPGADPHEGHGEHGVCGASGVPGCQNPPADVTPDVFMINGVSYPNTMERDDTLIWMNPGEKVRIRLVNVGETFETFHTHGHDMLVTHKDGNPLPPAARYWADTLAIGPAERYDVVLEGDKDAVGVWMAHTHVEAHITNDRQHPGGMHTMIVYEDYDGEMHGYSAELPGGMPRQEAREIPPDYRFEESLFFGAAGDTTGANSPRSIDRELTDIPVAEDLCLVRSLSFSAHLNADSKSMANTDLEISIVDRGGNMKTPHKLQLGGGTASGSWNPSIEDVKAGNHKVTLTGSTIEATVTLMSTITYYPSVDSAAAAGRPCSMSGDGHAHAH